MFRQRTICVPSRAVGIGLHSGRKVELVLRPADTDTGILFHRTDLPVPVSIPATPESVGDTRMASTLVKDGVRISTVEHLMSACAGLGIDNLHIDVNAEEIPIMDGSASSFVFLLQQAGLREQSAPKKYVRVKKTVTVYEGTGADEKWAQLEPYNGFRLDFFIDFKHPAIDATLQRAVVDLGETSYVQSISRARTFGFVRDVEALRGMGLARGGSLENAVVMDEYRVLNPHELRYEDEFVRHKILDAIGDLYMLGRPLLASYTAHKSGHALNNKLIRELLSQPDTYELVTFDTPDTAPRSLFDQSVREWLPA